MAVCYTMYNAMAYRHKAISVADKLVLRLIRRTTIVIMIPDNEVFFEDFQSLTPCSIFALCPGSVAVDGRYLQLRAELYSHGLPSCSSGHHASGWILYGLRNHRGKINEVVDHHR